MALILGMAALGVLVGTFVAWSASPIAATTLPLVFALLGGAGGFSILKMDLSTDDGQKKARILGLSIAAFSLACVITSIISLKIRPTFLQQQQLRASLEIENNAKFKDVIKKLVWRAQLEELGADPEEIKNILKMIDSNTLFISTEIDTYLDLKSMRNRGKATEKFSKSAEPPSAQNTPQGPYMYPERLPE